MSTDDKDKDLYPKVVDLLIEIKKMHEQINQGLESALKALDDHDYERVNEFLSCTKFISNDIMDTIDEMKKKTKMRLSTNIIIKLKDVFPSFFC